MTTLQEAMAQRQDLAEPLDEYLAVTFAAVDPVILELCRARIATLHGVPPERRDAAPVATELTQHQQACLAYVEQFVIDVHGLTDSDAERVKAGMTDAEFVAFTVALGLLDGIGRMQLVLDLDP